MRKRELKPDAKNTRVILMLTRNILSHSFPLSLFPLSSSSLSSSLSSFPLSLCRYYSTQPPPSRNYSGKPFKKKSLVESIVVDAGNLVNEKETVDSFVSGEFQASNLEKVLHKISERKKHGLPLKEDEKDQTTESGISL